jgi:hypothetical protein
MPIINIFNKNYINLKKKRVVYHLARLAQVLPPAPLVQQALISRVAATPVTLPAMMESMQTMQL